MWNPRTRAQGWKAVLSILLAGATAASADDLATARATLLKVRTELDAEQPKLRTSIEALNANRLEALGGAWATARLKQIKDGTSSSLINVPDSTAKRTVLAKLADLARTIDTFSAVNRTELTRWSTANTALQSTLASVPPLHARLGDLAPRLGTVGSIATDIESVATELQRQLAAEDGSVAVALTTQQGQAAAWQAVLSRGQELGAALNKNGNFGSTPGLSGDGMIQAMAEMNMTFQRLQEAAQTESRRYQTLSNASRARHSTVLSVIRSIK